MNKKGLTLVELVSCISIISVVIVVLFQLIISIQNNQNKKEQESDTNLTIAMITREIQKDMEAYGLDQEMPKECDTTNESDKRNQIIPQGSTNGYCIEITFDSTKITQNKGYIIYYQNNNKGFLGYKRGKDNIMETQIVREIDLLPEKNKTITINKIEQNTIYSLQIKLPLGSTSDNKALVINYMSNIPASTTI